MHWNVPLDTLLGSTMYVLWTIDLMTVQVYGIYYGSPDGRQNRHLGLSNGFWRLSSRADRQIGKSERSVASR